MSNETHDIREIWVFDQLVNNSHKTQSHQPVQVMACSVDTHLQSSGYPVMTTNIAFEPFNLDHQTLVNLGKKVNLCFQGKSGILRDSFL